MKRYLLILICCLPLMGHGQICTLDTLAEEFAWKGKVDRNGNYYFTNYEQSLIKRIDPQGVITIIAGTGVAGYAGDGGQAIQAAIHVRDLEPDSLGNLFLAEFDNQRIRKIDIATGIITTVAGTGMGTNSGDGGPAINASIRFPSAVDFDSHGNLYIYGDTCIRKIDLSGNIYMVKSFQYAFPGLDEDICIDIFDNIYFIHGITIMRTDSYGADYPALPSGADPWDLTTDIYGNLYFADHGNNQITRINQQHVAEVVWQDYAFPTSISVDSCGNMFFAHNYYQVDPKLQVLKVTLPYCNALDVVTPTLLTFTLSPNPATSQLTITSNTKLKHITITNTFGQQVINQTSDEQKTVLDISELPTGVYFARIADANGASRTEKLIKQ